MTDRTDEVVRDFFTRYEAELFIRITTGPISIGMSMNRVELLLSNTFTSSVLLICSKPEATALVLLGKRRDGPRPLLLSDFFREQSSASWTILRPSLTLTLRKKKSHYFLTSLWSFYGRFLT